MRTKTPSFIADFPLRVTAADERELGIRMEAARHIYNASLGEALRRAALMRQSKAWQAARRMPRKGPGKKARAEAFHAYPVSCQRSRGGAGSSYLCPHGPG